MRNLIKFGLVAVITMAFWGPGTSAAAQGYPSGSYQQTCRNIGTNGNTLEADCQTQGGQWNRTSLRNYRGCGEIANDNGTLRCTGDNNGGYNNNSGYNNGSRDRDGDRRDHDGDRDNNGGYQNGQNGYQNGVPGGSYTQTCQDIHISGNTLKASCKRSNGHYRQTSLDNFNQCSDISNNNGKLRCSR